MKATSNKAWKKICPIWANLSLWTLFFTPIWSNLGLWTFFLTPIWSNLGLWTIFFTPILANLGLDLGVVYNLFWEKISFIQG